MSTKTLEFNFEMTCEGCSNAAKRVLGKKNITEENIVIDMPGQKITVTSSLTAEELMEILKKTGKAVSFSCEKN